MAESAPPTTTPPHLADGRSDDLGVEVPSSCAPLAVVVLSREEAKGPPPEGPLWEARWRRLSVPATGCRGEDLKQAFREGLRAGGQCLVIWPQELGDWRASVCALARPIFAQRAEMVFTAWLPEARAAALAPAPCGAARALLGRPPLFVPGAPLAIARRALDTIPFETDDDGPVADLQLLAQAHHFGLQVAAVPLPAEVYAALGARQPRPRPSALAQLACGVELVMHRWGLIDAQRFQPPDMAQIGRWMIGNEPR